MVSINMNGRQSFLLNDIKNTIRNGDNVTHILNIKISNEQINATGNAIRKRIFHIIRGQPIIEHINRVPVSITWRTSANTSSAYYHADVSMFTDIVVKCHTEMMLRRILDTIDNEFDNVFTNGITGLAFIVRKPLTREIVVTEDDMLTQEVEASGEDEVDESQKNI